MLPIPELPMISGLGRRRSDHGKYLLRAHHNDGIEICFIRSGEYRWQVEGEVFQLQPGDGFITMPWQEHGGEHGFFPRGALDWVIIRLPRCTPLSPWRWGDWLPLSDATRRFITSSLHGRQVPRLPRQTRIGLLFDQLWEETLQRQSGWQDSVHLVMAQMLLTAARTLDADAGGPGDPDLEACLRHITQHIDQTWSLNDMAALAGLARSAFAERVRRATGLSPRRWLERTRLKMAHDQLLRRDDPITDIAMSLGFSSSQYFATAFKREYGCTPSQIRRQGGIP
jgi:AraC-like DNA-binding protein